MSEDKSVIQDLCDKLTHAGSSVVAAQADPELNQARIVLLNFIIYLQMRSEEVEKNGETYQQKRVELAPTQFSCLSPTCFPEAIVDAMRILDVFKTALNESGETNVLLDYCVSRNVHYLELKVEDDGTIKELTNVLAGEEAAKRVKRDMLTTNFNSDEIQAFARNLMTQAAKDQAQAALKNAGLEVGAFGSKSEIVTCAQGIIGPDGKQLKPS